MTSLENRFTHYSGGALSKQELDDAIFCFLGFVKTAMLIEKDNQQKSVSDESCNSDTRIKQRARRRKIS